MQRLLFLVAVIVLLPHLLRFVQWLLTAVFKLLLGLFVLGLLLKVGIITRINQRTATIDTGNGHSWRVGFGLLRHVVDI